MPIPGTTNPQRLVENCNAAEVTLTAGELEEIETALAHIHAQGDRYPEVHMRMINR